MKREDVVSPAVTGRTCPPAEATNVDADETRLAVTQYVPAIVCQEPNGPLCPLLESVTPAAESDWRTVVQSGGWSWTERVPVFPHAGAAQVA